MSNIWVGWDDREQKTYEACRRSILRRSPTFKVHPLKQYNLREAGLYWRAADEGAATSFSLTRFLVPSIQQYQGWALFCDCDFIFTRSLSRLFGLGDPTKAVQVVKHGPELWHNAHGTGKTTTKMDGKAQSYYPCKWWSALMLFNCGHPANRALTAGAVNRQSPSWLHRFAWLGDENLIGDLPHDWHWLDGYSEPPTQTVPMYRISDGTPLGEQVLPPAGIHFTRGSPELEGWENTRYADLWRTELNADL
jgi:hypothetical protein